jgi:hypothetical protein
LLDFITNNVNVAIDNLSKIYLLTPAYYTQLQKVHIYVCRNPYLSIPEAEILASFQEPAADEIDVYVGTKKAIGQNFILED